MKKLPTVKIAALASCCAALAFVGTEVKAADSPPTNTNAAALFGNIGGSFVFTPTANPGVFNITADGIGQASVIGNFTDHAELQVTFLPPGGPFVAVATGTSTWTTSDGTVNASITFVTTADPARNPFIFNNTYHVTITGGTGAFASAAGSATETEVVKFKPDFSGGAWSLTVKGFVVTPPSGS